MKRRPVLDVILLMLVTLGIYAILWLVITKGELEDEGVELPTSWCLLVPLVNALWMWQFCGGLAEYTRGRVSQGVSFLALMFIGILAIPMFQASLNGEIDRRKISLPVARAV